MRPGSWEPLIDEASQRFGVPQDVIMATMRTESGGQRGAVSPKGAAGLMQLMLPTYQELAAKHGFGPDRFDPRNNIQAGTAYLRQMYDQFGNWNDALAAYNAGPGRMSQVKAGTATLPAETRAYVPAVTANFTQTKEPGMPLFGSGGGASDADMDWWRGGLLQTGATNWYDGLGILGNLGQNRSQPPRTEPTTDTTQTQRMDVSGRINELLQQLSQTPAAGPIGQAGGLVRGLTPGQYQLAGAGEAVGKLAGVHDRKVGIGELLGALGGGLTRGTLAGQQAGREEAESEVQNLYRLAAAQKALAPTSDADRYKVVGKHVYDTVTKQFIASPEAAGDGAFEGNAAEVQGVNALIKAGKITPEQGAIWLASKTAVGPNGQFDIVNPLAVPGNGPAAAPPAAPGTASAVPAPDRPGVVTVRPPEAIPPAEATDLRKKIDTLTKLRGSAAALGQNVTDTGLQIGGFGASGGRQAALYEDVQTQLRLANELGVLNGPDERKLLEQISNPTKFEAYIKGLGGPAYFNAQMQVLNEKIDRELAQHRARLGEKLPASPAGSPNVLRFDAQGNPIK